MKKTISLLIAVLMLIALFAGCGGQSNTKPSTADNEASENSAVSEKEAADVSEDAPANSSGDVVSGGTAADSYTAYINAKGVVVNKIADGLTNNEDTALTAMSVLGFTMADMALIPASFFGLGEQSVESGLSMLSATDVQYTENGNSYTIAYKTVADEENASKAYSFSGTFDPATDSLTCTASTDGVETITAEYHKTSFGYVGQYYFSNEDGTTKLYLVAVDGEDGTIGISTTPGKPAALTGSESADFPKSCAEWYSVKGTTITGKTSDGTDLNFEYTPTESASN
jgi:hypothetical protein